MTEMLILARRNLKFLNREMAYLTQDEDTDYMVNACYYTHMVIELGLKHLLEKNGLPSNFTHQLKTLIKMCLGYELPIPDEVLTYYDEMRDWDTQAAYNSQFKGDYRIVKCLHPIVNTWLQTLSS